MIVLGDKVLIALSLIKNRVRLSYMMLLKTRESYKTMKSEIWFVELYKLSHCGFLKVTVELVD